MIHDFDDIDHDDGDGNNFPIDPEYYKKGEPEKPKRRLTINEEITKHHRELTSSGFYDDFI